jgi:hypothetical protein
MRSRLLVMAIGVASVVAGAIAGCGIDDVGSLVLGVDASVDTKPVLPPSGDGSITDGGGAEDSADADAQGPITCAQSLCAARGGRCADAGNECIIECTDAGTSCQGTIACPPGVGCRVVCAADDTCAQKVDCTQATACNVVCSGKHTCAGVACAGKTSAVSCTGMDSCQTGAITCTATDSCRISCTGGGMKNCNDAVTCTSASCSVVCNKDACPTGVTAHATDASIQCGMNACAGGANCYAQYCKLACQSGSCNSQLCCDGGTCLLDGGANTCP